MHGARERAHHLRRSQLLEGDRELSRSWVRQGSQVPALRTASLPGAHPDHLRRAAMRTQDGRPSTTGLRSSWSRDRNRSEAPSMRATSSATPARAHRAPRPSPSRTQRTNATSSMHRHDPPACQHPLEALGSTMPQLHYRYRRTSPRAAAVVLRTTQETPAPAQVRRPRGPEYEREVRSTNATAVTKTKPCPTSPASGGYPSLPPRATTTRPMARPPSTADTPSVQRKVSGLLQNILPGWPPTWPGTNLGASIDAPTSDTARLAEPGWLTEQIKLHGRRPTEATQPTVRPTSHHHTSRPTHAAGLTTHAGASD